jgi:hypothetical protein
MCPPLVRIAQDDCGGGVQARKTNERTKERKQARKKERKSGENERPTEQAYCQEQQRLSWSLILLLLLL